MTNWFTADTHFGHFNIIRYCNRPYKTLNQMNKAIIRNHNRCVKPTDTFFHLGDFCFKNSSGGKVGEGDIHNAEYYIKKLNGRPVFIKGNHDSNNSLKTPIDSLILKSGGHVINCTHNPKDYKPNMLNFCGHVHDTWKFKKIRNTYLINVGVDVWNFAPQHINTIIQEFDKWKLVTGQK